MPFISRLKNLGTVAVPELNTTLTVHLFNLEGSEETNLVYAAKDPIAANASPPANLCFMRPEGQSKRGDVLLWASKLKPRTPCIVRRCWVFDGMVWVKPDWNSQVRMEHPEHSDYQLVVLSGPFVKWELKPDPDCKPPLSMPDPPPVRLGVHEAVSSSPTATEDTELRRTTRQSESRRDGSLWITTPELKTPESAAEQCNSWNKLHYPPSQWNQSIYPPRIDPGQLRASARILFKEERYRDSCKRSEKLAIAKRPRPPSPGPSSKKKRKTTSDSADEPSHKNGHALDLPVLLQKLDATLQNRDDSPLSGDFPCDVPPPPSPLPVVADITAAQSTSRISALGESISPIETLGIRNAAADRRHKAALPATQTRHNAQVTQLNQDLDDQKKQVSELKTSLRKAQDDRAALKARAINRKAASRRALDLATEKLESKERLASRLADELDAEKERVEELQRTLVGNANALEAKICEVVSIQASYSKFKDASASEIRELSDELLSCKSALKESRQDAVVNQEVAQDGMRTFHRSAADLARDFDVAQAETGRMNMMSPDEKYQETLHAIETRFKMRNKLVKKTGKEKRLETEREALDRQTREQGRLLAEAQAMCLRLKADSSSERERHAVELSQNQIMHGEKMKTLVQEFEGIRTKHATTLLDLATSRQVAQNTQVYNASLEKKIKDAVGKQEAAQDEMKALRLRMADLTRELEAAREEMVRVNATSLEEREKLQKTLRDTEARLERDCFKFCEQLAGERGEKERIEREREALERGTREQGGLLAEAQATCLRLKVDSSSERERHVAELSHKQALHDERMEAVVRELEEIRIEHATTLSELSTSRQVARDVMVNNAALEQKVKDTVEKQETTENEMKALRRRTADLTHDLEASHADTASVKAISVEEREKLQKTLRAIETRLEQDCFNLREQLAGERGEKERIEREREALERGTREQGGLLAEAQATCLRLKVDSSSERERHVAELSHKQALHDERMEAVVRELEEIRIEHETSLLDLTAVRQEAQGTRVNNIDLKQKLRDTRSLLAIRDWEKKTLQEKHAEALEKERWKREDAEKLLDAVRRECREPFVIPTLLDLFLSAHMEARKLRREEGGGKD